MEPYELVVTGIGFPEASVRGVSQTFEPIAESSQLTRDVNGNLIDISNPAFRKFTSTLSCSDQVPPTLAGLWPGMVVTVDSVAEWSYLTATGAPVRPVVSSRVEGSYTFYRPRLVMVVVEPWRQSSDPWNASVQWQLVLQEQ